MYDKNDPRSALVQPAERTTPPVTSYFGYQLVDIFAPPRADFSSKPGWVPSAEDDPMLRGA